MRILATRASRFALATFVVVAVGTLASRTASAQALVIKAGEVVIPGVDANGALQTNLGGMFDTTEPGNSPIIIVKGQVMNLSGKAFTEKVAVSVDGETTTARLTISASGQASAIVKKP